MLARRAGTRARRGNRLTQPIQCRTFHGVAVEVLFDQRRFGPGVPLQIPVFAKDSPGKIAAGRPEDGKRDFEKDQAMQQRRSAGGQCVSLVEPHREFLLLAEHGAKIEIGQLRVKIVDDRQSAEFGGHLADLRADSDGV